MEKLAHTGKVLIIGCGSVSQCTLPILLKLIEIPATSITVIDFVDNRDRIKDLLAQGVSYVQTRITPENYSALLEQYVSAGDIIIDLGWNIHTPTMLEWCHNRDVRYVNTSVECWDPYEEGARHDPRPFTLYARQMELQSMIQRWGSNSGASAIVDHGANPGLVSHFTKYALRDICNKIVDEKKGDHRIPSLKLALEKDDFRSMAHLSNVQVVHISERDTQIADQPKRMNEFVNTWSVEGLYEEGVAPAEMGWGSHERTLPEGAFQFEQGPKNAICLSSLGVNTFVRSWVPSGPIVGMVIRHGEAFGISDRLTVWEGEKAIYRPTVHYVYCPSDSAIASLHELRMRQYQLQEDQRILNDEITQGWDELGVLLMGHDFNAWWTGSILSIDEARTLVPGQNATTVQVAISVVAAVRWMIKNPHAGVRLPDDVDADEILEIAKPYLGEFVSKQVAWHPTKDLDLALTGYGRKIPEKDDAWQFSTFSLGGGCL